MRILRASCMAAVGPSLRLCAVFMCNLSSASLSRKSFAAPTLPPTTAVPSTTPADECDDDQASCHSGTGDDYDATGANIALMRLRASLPSPVLPLLTLDSYDFPFVAVRSDTVASLLSCAHMHACAHTYRRWEYKVISAHPGRLTKVMTTKSPVLEGRSRVRFSVLPG